MGTLLIGIITRPYGSTNWKFVINLAKEAIKKGHKVKIWCSGDATYILKKNQKEFARKFNYEKDLKELIDRGVEIVGCESCHQMRGISEDEFIDKRIGSKPITWFFENVLNADKVIFIGE